MLDGLEVLEESFDIDSYLRNNSLSDSLKNKFVDNDFVILPSKYMREEYYYAKESVDFLKFCKNEDAEQKIAVLDNLDNIRIRSMHSFDIWLPVIWISENCLIPLAISMVAAYIYDKMRGKGEKAQVEVTFQVKDGKHSQLLHYKGDAECFEKTMKEYFKNINKEK